MYETFSFLDVADYAASLFQGMELELRPYGFPVDIGSLAASTSATVESTSPADGHLLVFGLVTVSNGATLPGVKLQVTDNGNNEQWFNDAQPLDGIAGNLNTNRTFPFPRLVLANSTLTFDVTTDSVAGFTSLEIAVLGVRVRVFGG